MKNRFVVLLSIVATSLCGCSFFNKQEDPTPSPTPSYKGEENVREQIDRPIPISGDGYSYIDSSLMKYTNKDVWNTSVGCVAKSTGNIDILVVPVLFKNSSRFWSQDMLNKVNNAFFGKSTDTSWQSVASYYNFASYGNINITGEVAPVYTVSKTKNELASYVYDGEPSPDIPVCQEWTQDSKNLELRKRHDKDGDGYIDSIVFVYNSEVDDENGFWAWVNWYVGFKPNVSNPVTNPFMWVSYDFIEGNNAAFEYGTDAHTLIHETGHLLGLYDYYTSSKIVDPSGGQEMHSAAIGDENIYTKFLLNWANPYYVKTQNEVTLKIRPSSQYGDAILLNDDWNGTPFDEYLMIEYYAPTGMNKFDAENQIYEDYKMFTQKGIRMYHIDSRLVQLNKSYEVTKFYTPSSKEELYSGYYMIGPDNEPARAHLPSGSSNIKQVQLIDAAGRQYFNGQNTKEKYLGVADNNSLFSAGSSYRASKTFFPNSGKFNKGNELGYEIKVESITSQYATITIKKYI